MRVMLKSGQKTKLRRIKMNRAEMTGYLVNHQREDNSYVNAYSCSVIHKYKESVCEKIFTKLMNNFNNKYPDIDLHYCDRDIERVFFITQEVLSDLAPLSADSVELTSLSDKKIESIYTIIKDFDELVNEYGKRLAKHFKEEVLPTKQEMVNFLENHFRYDVMNSWNDLTSYAKNIKVDKCIPKEYFSIALDIIGADEFDTTDLYMIIEDFVINNPDYRIIQNGRSGGYLVLVREKINGRECNMGQMALDHRESICELPMEEIFDRYKLVKEFDKTVQLYIDAFIDICKNSKVVEEEKVIKQTIKVVRSK